MASPVCIFSAVYINIMDQIQEIVKPAKDFIKDSVRLVKRCTKPDRKEFQKIAIATAIGFCIMGFIGFFVKLIHIPINNIIVGS
ncbi:Protein transport protein Sec61 subunit gamma [Holothuria leucospilota]|uniref:Protein transport protein Sec61 subunit gamma n=1 Tax=Holothuria leucospilota TaxID=206669 RepID=A0A9Q1BZW5_HOLLE|nr:Protein transport protein Sec61 subunit gamma [Holothuria leucospilota]